MMLCVHALHNLFMLSLPSLTLLLHLAISFLWVNSFLMEHPRSDDAVIVVLMVLISLCIATNSLSLIICVQIYLPHIFF